MGGLGKKMFLNESLSTASSNWIKCKRSQCIYIFTVAVSQFWCIHWLVYVGGEWGASQQGYNFSVSLSRPPLHSYSPVPQSIRIPSGQVSYLQFLVRIVIYYHESRGPWTIKVIRLSLSARTISSLYPIWDEKSYSTNLKTHWSCILGKPWYNIQILGQNLRKYLELKIRSYLIGRVGRKPPQ